MDLAKSIAEAGLPWTLLGLVTAAGVRDAGQALDSAFGAAMVGLWLAGMVAIVLWARQRTAG